jgi:Tfp pilus assembly protein PilF
MAMPFRKAVVSLVSVLVLLISLATTAAAERRVAMIIGNAAYQHQGRLSNPLKDATDIADILVRNGFALVGGRALVDLTKGQMDRAVREFGIAARDADVAFVYYSGHGLQIGGTNYLVPIDAGTVTEADVGLETLSVDLVMRQLDASQARFKMIVLDACRNNPFAVRRTRAVERGLASMQAPAGTIIGFATQPGNVASDGDPGGNSPYTAALREHMIRPGLGLFELLNDVGLAVMRTTKGQQQPWMAASPIAGKFSFVSPAMIAPPSPTPVAISQNPVTSIPLPSDTVSSGAALPLIQQAYKALSDKNYALAESVLAEAARVDPASALPHSFRGYAAYMQGNDQLESARRKRSAADRDAAVSVALRFYGDAFRSYDRAILISSQYAPVRRHRGNAIIAVYNARRLAGMPVPADILDRAIADLRTAAELDPTSKTNANALGDGLLLKNDPAEAIGWFDRAIALDRSYAAPYDGICRAQVQLGDFGKARRYARDAAARDSDLRDMPCLGPMARGR